ncbi:methyl-accepting chemotaxis protein [Acetonema longum]|uniref:Methyl-accepting chemotaxis protein n=1 Tax=Acetonema longum DSM 6540 TaxID=1009370 RepID=F7NHT7_9FIRM|nr:HAMP domain-containing methyl-accepting chemotaxis protein [Acetonema longum]EGO64462.1 methyl-accepting chemotaxis protein [Acetonema longum DSM 6540]
MKRIPIGTQLSAIFGFTLLLLTILLGVTIYEFYSVSNAYQELLAGPVPRSLALQKAQDNFHQGLSELRGYVSYGDEAFGANAVKELSATTEAIERFTAHVTVAESRQIGEKLQVALKSYLITVKQVIAAKKSNDSNVSVLLSEAQKGTVTIDKLFNAILLAQENALKQIVNGLSARQSLVFTIVIGANVLGILIVIGVLIWFSRNLAGRINHLREELITISNLDLSQADNRIERNDEIGDMAQALLNMKRALRGIVGQVRTNANVLAASSEELTSAVEEQLRVSHTVAKTVGEIADGSVQTTNNITEISSVVQEVTAGAEEMSAGANEVNALTKNAVTDASQGMQLIQEVVAQNNTIEESMGNITTVSSSLVKGSADIQEIVTVIRNIAGQTNLLALNAAIEAARAGDAGRGFAVVADEVRKLAEQSASATNHIEEIIRKMTADIQFSVDVVNRANSEVTAGKTAAVKTQQGFQAIIDKLEQVKTGIDQMNRAVEETATGMQTVVHNVQSMSAVAQQTSASTQTVAAAAEEQNASLAEVNSNAEALATLATELNEITKKFIM